MSISTNNGFNNIGNIIGYKKNEEEEKKQTVVEHFHLGYFVRGIIMLVFASCLTNCYLNSPNYNSPYFIPFSCWTIFAIIFCILGIIL